MFATGIGKIYFLKRSLDTPVYQDVLNHFLISYIEDKFGNNEFIFQHDFVPLDSVKSTEEWFKRKTILVFNWPANSPDANPIEHLWGILKGRLRKYYPSNLEELKWVVIEVRACFTRDLWFDWFVTRINERNIKCKRCYSKILSVLIQFFKSVFINKYFSW